MMINVIISTDLFYRVHKVVTSSQVAKVEAGDTTVGVLPSPEDLTSAGNEAQSTNEPDE